MRRWCLALAFVTTLFVPSWVLGEESDQNTQIARQIAGVMRDHANLGNEDLNIRFSGGIAYIRGTVHTEEQMATAIKVAQASPYVHQVEPDIQVTTPAGSVISQGGNQQSSVRLTGLTQQESAAPPRSVLAGSMPVPMAASSLGGPSGARLAQIPQMPGAAPMGMGDQPMPQPAYVPGAGGGVARAAYDQPHMPGYAWPSYAAYPNYAALTYPKQYSPTAWPYIGPFYPYPQVPLGWRKVTLHWNDGWWFLDFKD